MIWYIILCVGAPLSYRTPNRLVLVQSLEKGSGTDLVLIQMKGRVPIRFNRPISSAEPDSNDIDFRHLPAPCQLQPIDKKALHVERCNHPCRLHDVSIDSSTKDSEKNEIQPATDTIRAHSPGSGVHYH